MSNLIQFELASPEKLAFNKQVVMVTIPGSSGLYGVLSGHAPMITAVEAGVVQVYERDETKPTGSYFVSGGFAEVSGQRCTLLADSVVSLDDLKRPEISAELKAIDEDLMASETEDERNEIEKRRDLARAKLLAVGG